MDHVAKAHRWQQISASDAQNQIRVLIAEKFVSYNRQRKDFENDLASHAANFGISADEVSALIDKEIRTGTQLRARHHLRLIVVAITVLIVLCAIGTGFWLWRNPQTSPLPNRLPTKPIVNPTTVEPKEANTEPIPQELDCSQRVPKNRRWTCHVMSPKHLVRQQ